MDLVVINRDRPDHSYLVGVRSATVVVVEKEFDAKRHLMPTNRLNRSAFRVSFIDY